MPAGEFDAPDAIGVWHEVAGGDDLFHVVLLGLDESARTQFNPSVPTPFRFGACATGLRSVYIPGEEHVNQESEMDSADSIEIKNFSGTRKTVYVTVSRGRAVVRWPLVGEFDLDLDTGHLVTQPLPMRGIYTVDATGRVVGTRALVDPSELLRLDAVVPGDTLRLTHTVAVVVDVLPSEGSIKIFLDVEHDPTAMRPRSMGWSVTHATLRRLREQAGLFVAMAG